MDNGEWDKINKYRPNMHAQKIGLPCLSHSSRLLSIFVFSLLMLTVSGVDVVDVEVSADMDINSDVFSVQALIDSVAIPEKLEINSAIDMVSSPWALPDDKQKLFEASVQTKHGEVPLLHHLFNLYSRFESQPQARYLVFTEYTACFATSTDLICFYLFCIGTPLVQYS